jgi:hypothetical protein
MQLSTKCGVLLLSDKDPIPILCALALKKLWIGVARCERRMFWALLARTLKLADEDKLGESRIMRRGIVATAIYLRGRNPAWIRQRDHSHDSHLIPFEDNLPEHKPQYTTLGFKGQIAETLADLPAIFLDRGLNR